jgi:outer membrane protein assembly factor BamD
MRVSPFIKFPHNFLVVFSLILMLQVGCARVQKLYSSIIPSSRTPETAESLVMEGMDDFNHGRYRPALDIFEKLKDRYPFSRYSLLAELKIADCQYYLKNYPEALIQYQEFEERHPSNEAIPYVMFQIGMSHYNQIDTIDRDTSGAMNAIQAFSRLLRTFPDTPYTIESQARIKAAKNFLAKHEFYVAGFYVRTRSYSEAEARLEYLLTQYPDTAVAPQAKKLLDKLKAGTPPKRGWSYWLPDLSLPDWRIFSSSESEEESL